MVQNTWKYHNLPYFKIYTENLESKLNGENYFYSGYLILRSYQRTFIFKRPKKSNFWRGSLRTPEMKNEGFFLHFCINLTIKIKKWTKNNPFFSFLKALWLIFSKSLFHYMLSNIPKYVLAGGVLRYNVVIFRLKSLCLDSNI